MPQRPSKTKHSDPEQRRLKALVAYEEQARSRGFRCIAGIDEAGRGPLAGPVYAAACIIPEGLFFPGIDDSKQLGPDEREALFEALTAHSDVAYAIGMASHDLIDRINIYQATIVAMIQAVDALPRVPDYLLVDGLKLPHPTIPAEKIIKGDTLSQSIAAASIIAKVLRDRKMMEIDRMWPQYGFRSHKGYGTEKHLAALKEYGPCPFHRKTFAPCSNQVSQLSLFSS